MPIRLLTKVEREFTPARAFPRLLSRVRRDPAAIGDLGKILHPDDLFRKGSGVRLETLGRLAIVVLMKALLGKHDLAQGFSLIKKPGLMEVGIEDLDVLGWDFRGVEVERVLGIIPGGGVKEALWVGVIGDSPFEIALESTVGLQHVQHVAGDVFFRFEAFGRSPVVGERNKHPGRWVHLPSRQISDTHGPDIMIHVQVHGLVAHVGPVPSDIDFVVQNPVVDQAAFFFGTPFCQKRQNGSVRPGAVFGREVGHHVE
jgi:hypothetical protein